MKRPIILPARARFHPEKLDEIAAKTAEFAPGWAAQFNVSKRDERRQVDYSRDVSEILRATSGEVDVDAFLDHERAGELTFDDYLAVTRDAADDFRTTQAQTLRGLYGLGLRRFSVGQCRELVDRLGLPWLSPTYYQRVGGEPLRDPGVDVALSKELRQLLVPYVCGCFSRTGEIRGRDQMRTQIARFREAGIVVGVVWVNLDWADAVEGVVEMVRQIRE